MGVLFDDDAAECIVLASRSYPFFIQICGRLVWSLFAGSGESLITRTVADQACVLALCALDARLKLLI